MQKVAFNPATLTRLRPLQSLGRLAMSKMIRPAIGRVTTNVVDPFGYDVMDKIKNVRKAGLRKVLESVIKDKPMYEMDEWAKAREVPNRMMYGLKPRTGENAYLRTGKDTLTFNPKDEAGQSYLREILHEPTGSGHGVMGNFAKGYDRGSGTMKYYDDWDFGLNAGEKMTPRNKEILLARWAMSKVTDPVKLKGSIPFKELGARKLNSVNRISTGGNIDYDNAPKGIPSLLGQSEARMHTLKSRLDNSLERYMDASTRPGMHPRDIQKLNSTFERRYALLEKMKQMDDVRGAHQKASVTFNGDTPKYLKPGSSLADTMRGTQYEKYVPYLEGAQRVGKGLDYVDRALVPGAAFGGTAMLSNHMMQEPPPPPPPPKPWYSRLLGTSQV